MNSEIGGGGLFNWNREMGGGYYLKRQVRGGGLFDFNREIRAGAI